MTEPLNDWLTLENMLEAWLDNGNAFSFEERQALIPVRDFIYTRAHPDAPRFDEETNQND
jgi:hypothetical protein